MDPFENNNDSKWFFAIESSGDGVWDWNFETGAVFYSSRWKSMLGYKDDEIKNRIGEWKRRVHPDDLDRCISQYLSSFDKRIPFYIQYRLRHHDGSYHRIADYGAPIYDLKGEFTGYIGSCYDLDKEEP